jgi:hypothetical protein
MLQYLQSYEDPKGQFRDLTLFDLFYLPGDKFPVLTNDEWKAFSEIYIFVKIFQKLILWRIDSETDTAM